MPATVLLIDANAEDEQLFREELALIRDQPFQLQIVRTLAEALARLRPGNVAASPDVILLDLTLMALKASETRYRELYENVVAGVFQTTPDGKFMAANPVDFVQGFAVGAPVGIDSIGA